jgi:intracellular sulfur oxidation DsrE/DsrF family protein
VIGANSTGFPINASDALWAKFKLGERYDIKDPATGQPAIRTVYLGTPVAGTGSTVRTLQARGAVFLMCNNSLQGLATDYARENGTPASDMHAELIAGLNPGVRVVPALTWAVGMLQEAGFTYEKL